MALRSGYKGFKKLLGLKTIRPGTLAVDDAALANTFFPRSEQAVLGAKNLLDLSSQQNRENVGVICNIINHNQFSITGQTTGSGAVPLADETGNLRLNTIQGKRYRIIAQVLSGSFTVGSGNNTIYIRKPVTNHFYANLILTNNKTYSTGDIILNQTFVADSNNAVSYGAQLWMENITFNDCVIGWSMQLATDEDTSYVPYAMTNKELTDAVSVKNGLSSVTVIEGATLSANDSFLRKQNNVISAQLRVNGVTANSGANIATIPSGFIPSLTGGTVVFMSNASTGEMIPAYITINGYVRTRTNLSAVDVNINFTYIAP